jgi:chromosome segregation ATPase
LLEKHNVWKEKLDGIVSKISETFSQSFEHIGCAGEVRIRDVPDDYAKWSIEIWVKFRDVETLQVLNSHRQSGGERSVSTMLYLISLQSLSKSPFRVVDEINQGMDPRNERLVHKLIVRAACISSNSQYVIF